MRTSADQAIDLRTEQADQPANAFMLTLTKKVAHSSTYDTHLRSGHHLFQSFVVVLEHEQLPPPLESWRRDQVQVVAGDVSELLTGGRHSTPPEIAQHRTHTASVNSQGRAQRVDLRASWSVIAHVLVLASWRHAHQDAKNGKAECAATTCGKPSTHCCFMIAAASPSKGAHLQQQKKEIKMDIGKLRMRAPAAIPRYSDRFAVCLWRRLVPKVAGVREDSAEQLPQSSEVDFKVARLFACRYKYIRRLRVVGSGCRRRG